MDIRIFLEEIARGAGAITLKYFQNNDLEIFSKTDESPVTRADRESEQYLRQRIRAHFPDDVIIGEEFGTDGSNGARRWILDPIDGTKSFIHGVPLYGVLIGLEENGIVTHGVCYLPGLDEMVSAATGMGCFWNGERANVSEVDSIGDALVLATEEARVRSYLSEDVYRSLIGSAKLFRTWGDCYGHVLVATGRADLMIDPKMAIWDSSPFWVILEEAGGAAFDLSGKANIEGGSLISCNRKLSEFVKRVISR